MKNVMILAQGRVTPYSFAQVEPPMSRSQNGKSTAILFTTSGVIAQRPLGCWYRLERGALGEAGPDFHSTSPGNFTTDHSTQG